MSSTTAPSIETVTAVIDRLDESLGCLRVKIMISTKERKGNHAVSMVISKRILWRKDETIVNLIITDIEEQVFSVSSNSTVSNLAFNSTAREITFTVSGPDNTTGYLNIFLSKDLTPDIDGLRIYFDYPFIFLCNPVKLGSQN